MINYNSNTRGAQLHQEALGYFAKLPVDTLQAIFIYLDSDSLIRMTYTSNLLRKEIEQY